MAISSYSDLIFNDDDPRLMWREGDEVIIKTEQNGQYFNFKSPTRLDYLEERVERLERLRNTSKEAVSPRISAEDYSGGENLAYPQF